MEHVEGRDAQQVLDALAGAGRAFPIDLAAHVVAELCRGLAYAHGARKGLVHRDVSPQNVLLSLAGEVKLADFGIAQTRARRSDPNARVIKGKYFYMSPEQARAEPLDARSDIFSAGVVLWELLAGRRLHQARDVRALLEAVRRAEVPPPSTLRPLVPPALDKIVARATARERSERYTDAGEMADALHAYLASRPPLRAARRIGRLLNELPPVAAPAELPPSALPQTRDVVPTKPAEHGTPPEPPLRHDLDDGRPTAVGWRVPAPEETAPPLLWAFAAGAALLVAAVWLLYGL
jgi:serine/threonine-protein kinase